MKRRSGSYNRPWRWRGPFLRRSFQRLLTTLGSVYQALQQWEEAHRALEEAVAVAEAVEFGHSRVRPVAAVHALCRGRGVGSGLPVCLGGHRQTQAH